MLQGDPELAAALKRHGAPNKPEAASAPAKKLAFAPPESLEAHPDKSAPATMPAVASAPTPQESRVVHADTPTPSAPLPRNSIPESDAATAQADLQRPSSDTRSAGPPSVTSSNDSTGGQSMPRERSVPYPEYGRGIDSGMYRGYGRAEGCHDGYIEGHYDGRAEGRYDGHIEGRYDGHIEGRYDGRAEGRYDGRYFDDQYGPRGSQSYHSGYPAAPPTRGERMDSRNYRYPPASHYPPQSHRLPLHHDYRHYGNMAPQYTHSREPSLEPPYHPSAPPPHRQRHPDAAVLSRVASPQAGPSRLA